MRSVAATLVALILTSCGDNKGSDGHSAEENQDAERYAQAFCDAQDRCACSEPSLYSHNDCIVAIREDFLSLLDSELAYSKQCLEDRIRALEYRDCTYEFKAFAWDKAACPIWSGERGIREACSRKGHGASDCAPGLYCIRPADYDKVARCEDAYRLPGEGEECVQESPQCAEGLYCELNLVDADGWVCIPKTVGDSCEEVWECGGTECIDQSCVDYIPPGGTCTQSEECDWSLPSDCQSGICTFPPPVECTALSDF